MYLPQVPDIGPMPEDPTWPDMSWNELLDQFEDHAIYYGEHAEFSLSAIGRGMRGLLDADRRAHRLWLEELEENMYPGHPDYAVRDFDLMKTVVAKKLARNYVLYMQTRVNLVDIWIEQEEKELKAREKQLAVRKAWMAAQRREQRQRRQVNAAGVLELEVIGGEGRVFEPVLSEEASAPTPATSEQNSENTNTAVETEEL